MVFGRILKVGMILKKRKILKISGNGNSEREVDRKRNESHILNISLYTVEARAAGNFDG